MSDTRIHAVHLYKLGTAWVFDDPEKGITKEALVMGIDDMITQLAKQQHIKHASVGMILRFSEDPFREQQLHLEWLCKDESMQGNWYHCPELDHQGWLCPVLYRYYDVAPQRLYASLGELPHMPRKIIKHYLKQLVGC